MQKIRYTGGGNKKNTSQILVEQSTTKTKKRKRSILQSIQENQSRATPHPVEKTHSRIQNSSQNEQEGRLGNFLPASLNSNAPINQARNRVRQLKGKVLKKANILEVSGAQYKDNKSIANKIGDALAELSLPQNYYSIFLDLKKM